jgi:hypothetical protein
MSITGAIRGCSADIKGISTVAKVVEGECYVCEKDGNENEGQDTNEWKVFGLMCCCNYHHSLSNYCDAVLFLRRRGLSNAPLKQGLNSQTLQEILPIRALYQTSTSLWPTR